MRPLAITPLLVACAAEPAFDIPTPEPLDIEPAESPLAIEDVDYVFYQDVAYDDAPRTVLDLFVPAGVGPFPVLLEIHGGGFTAGDEDDLYRYRGSAAHVGTFLERGIAFANIEYRLLSDDGQGVKRSLHDVRRALQFLRWHHAQLGLDPTRVVAGGASAGAGTALWLGTHPDMADPGAEDPVARQSTRVDAVAAFETQATYDIVRWETDVLVDYGITVEAASAFGVEELLKDFYGIQSVDELYEEPAVAYRASVDMLGLLSVDDPPIWVENVAVSDTLPLSVDALFHHPNHASVLREAALAVGVSVTANIPEKDVVDPGSDAYYAWVLDALRR